MSDKVKAGLLSFDKRSFAEFRAAYDKAYAAGAKSFTFQNYELLTSYAGYMIEALKDAPMPDARDDGKLPAYRHKLFKATRYNETRLGAIFMAIFDLEMEGRRLDRYAVVTSDGHVMCGFRTQEGEYNMGAYVAHLDDVTRNVVDCAVHCRLSRDEAADLMVNLARWLGANDPAVFAEIVKIWPNEWRD